MLLLGAALAAAPLARGQTVLPPPSADAQADARQDRVEELQRQLSQATADNETLQHQLRDARAEVSRLQGIVSDLTAANANAVQNTASVSPNGPQAPQSGTVNSDASLNPAQRAAVGTLGTMPSNAAQVAAPAPTSADAYANARALLTSGNYAEAEVAFTDFLQAYPSSREAPEARYWLGAALFARNNYTDAASAFVDYLRHTPNGPNAATAQVNLGFSLARLDHKPQACAAFADVPRRYPHASQAIRDRAAREALALHCTP
jgi:tol-pal system protein YbgF